MVTVAAWCVLDVERNSDINSRFSIEPMNGYWRLAQATQDAWSYLEESLKMAANILVTGHLLPLDFAWFPFPQTFSYKRTHRTHKIALRSAEISQQAFVLLAAMCSFAVALNLTNDDLDIQDPQWARTL